MRKILQSEAAECGLTSLAMVCDHFNLKLGLPELRRRFPLSLKGARLNQLMSVADKLGFQSRPLRLDVSELAELKLPCILHWDLNHFVVLVKANHSKLTIYDPAFGERKITTEEVSKHFTGVALELTPSINFKPEKKAPSIKFSDLIGPTQGLKRSLIQIFLLSCALQIFVLVSPLLMQGVMDHVLVTADYGLLKVLLTAFLLMLIIQISIGLMRSWASIYLSTRLSMQWMASVLQHLLRLPMDYFEKRHLGDITSRLGSVTVIQSMLTSTAISVVLDGMMAITTVAMMLVYSPKLALVSFAALGLYLAIRLATYRKFREANEEQIIKSAKQQSYLLETLRGISSLKVSGVESGRHSAWQNLALETQNQAVRIAQMGMAFGTVSQSIFGLERIIVIGLGAQLVLGNQFSIGMLVAYLAYKEQFSGRISGLIDTYISLRMLRLHGERLADIVLTEPEKDSGSDFEIAAPTSTEIKVEGLGFRYADGEPWVLKDLNFTVREGESVAIVGASGCGKTTLVKLLLGLLTPNEGVVSVGGHDIRKLGLRNYRAIVGAVMQDDQLFAGSVAENIAFGDESFDMARIEAAAKLAAVHDEIAAMPMGYYSLIGDMGTTLSGGQKQRVVLARALYRNPRILFLDEATSHLDVERERLVNDAVRQLKLTKIIIAHRPETIASADRVLVMHGGKIVQEYQPKPALVTPIAEVSA